MILIAVIYNVFKVYVYLFQILQTDHDIPKPNLSGDRSGGIFIRFKEIETQITSDLEFVINGLEFEIIVDDTLPHKLIFNEKSTDNDKYMIHPSNVLNGD